MTITWEWEIGGHFAADSMLYEFGSGNWDTSTGAYAYSTTEKKTGAGSIAFGDDRTYARKPTTASRQKRFGAFFYLAKVPNTGAFRLFSFRDASSNFLIEVLIKADGALALNVATAEQDTYASYPLTAWRHLGCDVKVDSSAGWAVVYLDGVEIMRFDGNTGNADIADVRFGVDVSGDSDISPSYMDDLYCEDTTGEGAAAAPPLRQFYEMRLSGNGNYSNFDGSDSNKTDNYALVDENPPNEDTDYVYAAAADVIDSYATTDYNIIAGMTVNAVHAYVIAKKTGVAGTQVKPFLREDSTDWAGTAQNCASDYILYIERRTTDPAGAAWDQTSINGLEVGVKSAGAYS